MSVPTANWSYPTSVRFGAGRIKELADACRAAGIERPLFVTDAGLAQMPITKQTVSILKDAGLPVAEFCRQQHAVQKEVGERFGLSWDHFGRTSAPQNHELTNHLAKKLDEHGYLEERVTKQVFSLADDRFLPDRYIIGTCPHCGYDRARGDQCENCTRVLDPTDLIEPRSAVSGSTDLEVRETKHVFLLQSQLAGEVVLRRDALGVAPRELSAQREGQPAEVPAPRTIGRLLDRGQLEQLVDVPVACREEGQRVAILRLPVPQRLGAVGQERLDPVGPVGGQGRRGQGDAVEVAVPLEPLAA